MLGKERAVVAVLDDALRFAQLNQRAVVGVDAPRVACRRASGRLRDLREAAAQSPELAEVLQQYKNAATKEEQLTLRYKRFLCGNCLSATKQHPSAKSKTSAVVHIFEKQQDVTYSIDSKKKQDV